MVDVDKMLASITSEQFEEWYTFWMIEPWDIRTSAAVISKTVADSMTHNIASRAGVEWKETFASKLAAFLPGWRLKKKPKPATLFGLPLRVEHNGND